MRGCLCVAGGPQKAQNAPSGFRGISDWSRRQHIPCLFLKQVELIVCQNDLKKLRSVLLYDISHFGFQIGSAFHDVSWKPCPVHYPVITQMWLKPQLNAVVGPHDVFAVSKLNKTVSTCTHETQQLGHRICYIGAPYFGIALWCALAQVVGFATHFSSHNLSHTAKQRNKTIQFGGLNLNISPVFLRHSCRTWTFWSWSGNIFSPERRAKH